MVDATIDVIDRGRMRIDANFAIEAHTVATADDPEPHHELLETPVYNLVIDHPEGTVLWDTGSHHEAGEGHWPGVVYEMFNHHDADAHRLDDDLAAAGYELDDIDIVVQTHLHFDHAGGLEFFDGTDVPVYVHETELSHAYLSAKAGLGGGYLEGDFDHDLEWRLVRDRRETLLEDVELIHLPGHTPGLMGMLVHLDSESLLFTSDTIELQANYRQERPPGPGLVWDKSDWYGSVHWLKQLEREHDAEVVFGHDAEQFPDIADGWP